MANPAPSLIFPKEEFAARLARLQEALARAGQDAILLTSAADIFYMTGFLTRFWESPARPWFVIVPQKGEMVAVIPSIGAPLMARTWLRQIRTWDAPDPEDDGLSLLVQTIADLVPQRGRIALPMGLETHLRMPLADYIRLQSALAPRGFTDGTALMQRLREIKSEAEIAKIRHSCAIAGRAFAAMPEVLHEGMALAEVFRRFQMRLLEEGADWVSYVAGAAAAEGYGDVISPATARPLTKGDVLMLDTGAVCDGYFCDYDRNYSLGGPPGDATARAHEALWLATDHALQTLRPGMRACDLHRLLCTELTRHGATPGAGRLGHGLGVTLTEWPSFTAKDTTPLRVGMVLTLEPGVEIRPGVTLVHEENIVLRDEGPELLSPRAPFTLPVIR